MGKGNFLKSRKLVKNTTILTVWFVIIALISSSSLSIELVDKSERNNFDFIIIEEETTYQKDTLTGLDPVLVEKNLRESSLESPMTQHSGPISEDGFFYACDAFSPYPVVRWELETGEGKETIASSGGNQYFLSGGTYSCDEVWYGCEYNSGGLWKIDPDTGDMENIGGGGTSCNGLAWDPVYNRLYGIGSGSLYEYDPETGEQEFIGLTCQSVVMVCMVIDNQGVAWAWDIKFSGNSILYNINLETGECTEYCDMGQNLVYAQDGDIDRDTGIIWMCAYSSGGFYAYWDWDACEIITICSLDSEYACAMIRSSCLFTGHDVGVKAILKPTQSGHALPIMDMELLVKNKGNHTETTDVKMQVYKFEEGPVLFEENFSGTFPPDNWTTDFWNQSFTNVAGGESPEAVVNNSDQYGGGQYYDNFIMTPPINATGWEKLKISFRWAFEQYSTYGQYCNFYVKWRMNDTSPWKDISPWDNPLGDDSEGDLYEIGCYGFRGNLGDGFQVMFQYVGYYYYYDFFYLDDIKITAFYSIEEYNETVEDIELAPGEEFNVEFPSWTPADFGDPDYENIWQDYIVKAWSLLEDDRPKNNYKEKIIDLYYPWMHDVELTSIDSPCEDGPGKTYPVEATIKNVGQNTECCISINIEIGETVVLDTLFNENSWDTVPPEGWYDEHKDISNDYGWQKSDTSHSGGNSPEAKLIYYKARADYVLYSYAIDTSDYSVCQLEFKSYIDHYSGSGLYALEAGYSHDGENWYAAWHEEPSGNGNYNVEVPIEGGSETTYIGFWVKGNPYYFDYWYIDDISVSVLDTITEYSESVCKSDDIEPGESITFEFEDWIPEFLQYETSDTKKYIVHAEIHMYGDKNPENDIKSINFELDYWHDPALEGETQHQYLLWENDDPDGRNGLLGSFYNGYDNLIIDDLEIVAKSKAQGGHISLVWDSGAGTGNLDTLYMWFFEETGDCEPSMDEYAKVEVTDFTETLTGDYYFSRPEVEITVEFDDVELTAGKWWIGFQPDSVGEDKGYLLTAENKGCQVMADLPYSGVPRWTPGSQEWGDTYDLAWQVTGYSTGPPGLNAYIQPGTESIDAVAINYGTFEELNLTCNAQIWEYINDPFGTKLYDDNITNINLYEPLGGTIDLAFGDFTFAYEGRYGLFFEMPGHDGRDDFPKNNRIRWGIGVDDTKPVSYYSLYPRNPDGDNGWYVNNLEVTLYAYDPISMDVSSGVREIKYQINGGPIESIEGDYGYFLLTQEHDGKDVLVEYWAIDNVGNEEAQHNTFTIDMDQTEPTVNLMYEVTGGNPIVGWTILFTATGNDVTSGMDRVEFYLNYLLQDVVSGPGPTYEWEFIYHGGLNLVITVWGFDMAGNMAVDEIDKVTNNFNQNTQLQFLSIPSSNNYYSPQQRLFVNAGGV